MKKLFLTFLLGVFALLQSLAVPSDSANAVTMVSYEQGWLDSRGTLALKNNTSDTIYNVAFLITYLDMSGRELDYEEFFEFVEIDPGKTRKIDIRAYEHSRSYHYYKSENSPTGSPAFKVKFELLEYNSDKTPYAYEDNLVEVPGDGSESETAIVIAIVAGIFIMSLIIGFYVLVAVMAKKRNRNVALWVLLSIIASPLLIIIILLVIGEDDRIDEFR